MAGPFFGFHFNFGGSEDRQNRARIYEMLDRVQSAEKARILDSMARRRAREELLRTSVTYEKGADGIYRDLTI